MCVPASALLAGASDASRRPAGAASCPPPSTFPSPALKSIGISMGSAGGSGASLGSTSVRTPSSRLPRMADTSTWSPTRKASSNFSSVNGGDAHSGAAGAAAPGSAAASSVALEDVAALSAVPADDAPALPLLVVVPVAGARFFRTAVMVSVFLPSSSETCASTSSFLHPGRSTVTVAASAVSTTSWDGARAGGGESDSSRATAGNVVRERTKKKRHGARGICEARAGSIWISLWRKKQKYLHAGTLACGQHQKNSTNKPETRFPVEEWHRRRGRENSSRCLADSKTTCVYTGKQLCTFSIASQRKRCCAAYVMLVLLRRRPSNARET